MWQLHVGATWQWQLGGNPSYTLPVNVYDFDILAQDSTFSAAQAKAVDPTRMVICYVNVGSLEKDGSRSDESSFSPKDLGNAYPGWPDEVFVDIRSENVRQIMSSRFKAAVVGGCDGIEPDNTGVIYKTASAGFNPPITAQDEANYIMWLQNEVHSLGMAIGSKNNGDLLQQYPSLLENFDFAIVESCVADKNCNLYTGFISAGKPVFAAEYTDAGSDGGCDVAKMDAQEICAALNALQFSGVIKDCALNEAATICNQGQKYAPYVATAISSGFDVRPTQVPDAPVVCALSVDVTTTEPPRVAKTDTERMYLPVYVAGVAATTEPAISPNYVVLQALEPAASSTNVERSLPLSAEYTQNAISAEAIVIDPLGITATTVNSPKATYAPEAVSPPKLTITALLASKGSTNGDHVASERTSRTSSITNQVAAGSPPQGLIRSNSGVRLHFAPIALGILWVAI